MPRPPTQHDGPLRAYARRAPTATDPRWYWQVVSHEEGVQHTVPGASGRYTVGEVRAVLRARLAAGDWRRPQAPTVAAAQTWGTLLTLHAESCEDRRDRGRLSPRTVVLYAWCTGHLRAVLGDRPLTAPLDLACAQQVIDTLEGRLSPRSVALCWRLCAVVWRWGQRRSYLPAGLLPQPELPPITGHRYRHATPDDATARAVVDQLPDDWRRLAGWLLLATGARVGEIAGLRWADWTPGEEGGVLVVAGKTGRREVWVGPGTAARIEAWRGRGLAPGSALLGVAPDTAMDMSAQLVAASRAVPGAPEITPHSLRRLASTRLIGAGVDPAAYEAQLGHSHAQGLRDYAQTTAATRAAAAAVLDAAAEGTAGQVIDLSARRLARESGEG